MFALVGVQLSVELVGQPVGPPHHVPSTLGAVLVAFVHLVEGLLELCHNSLQQSRHSATVGCFQLAKISWFNAIKLLHYLQQVIHLDIRTYVWFEFLKYLVIMYE